jgi:anti-anti-sigma regulatory factor
VDFQLSILARKHCAVVWVHGQCGADNAEWLRDCLVDLLEPSSARMVLDLSALSVSHGAGIDALAAVAQRARQLGGSLVITDGPALASAYP